MMRYEQDHQQERLAASFVAAVAFAAFIAFIWTEGAREEEFVLATAIFVIIFMPVPVLSVRRWRRSLGNWVAADRVVRTFALLSIPLFLYGAQALLTGGFDPAFLWTYSLYAGLPAALVLHASRDGKSPLSTPFRTGLAVLLIWGLLDFGWVTPFRVPAEAPRAVNLMRVLVLTIAVLLFTVTAPVRGLGFTFRIRARELLAAGGALVVLAVVLVPLGLTIDFLEIGVMPVSPAEWAVMAVTLYLTTTLHEEFLFRGLLQNVAEKWWPGPNPVWGGLLVGAIVFGLAHLNNPPAPNYRYVLMATLAGTAYGWVWITTRKITVSALTHLGVNWIWMVALRGG